MKPTFFMFILSATSSLGKGPGECRFQKKAEHKTGSLPVAQEEGLAGPSGQRKEEEGSES